MKKLPWVTLAILSAAALVNVATFAGCGSDSEVDVGDGGDNNNAETGTTPDTGTNPTPDGGNGADARADGAGIDPRDGAACAPVGNACATSSDCCTANCDPATKKCVAPVGTCKAPGAACAAGNECCTFTCVGGVCDNKLCIPDNQGCVASSDCCSGTCDGVTGFCKPLNTTCKTAGNPCAGNNDCCSKFCNAGICSAQPSFCTQTGDVCSTNNECCGGVCTKATGAVLGTCSVPSAPGATNCLPAGVLCGGAIGDAGVVDGSVPSCGGSCCSRSCAPYGPTGFNVCQPADASRTVCSHCRCSCSNSGVEVFSVLSTVAISSARAFRFASCSAVARSNRGSRYLVDELPLRSTSFSPCE